MRFTPILAGSLLLASATLTFGVATPALAQDATAPSPHGPDDTVAPPADTAPPSAFKITGGATVVSDYRFRGLTQSNEFAAVQGTVNINHESGLYVGTWASMIDGGPDGSTPALTGYGGAEVDLYGGFAKTYSGVGIDVGLLYYFYPGGQKNQNTDFFEPYGSLSYTIGPVAAKAGFAYAWSGQKGLDFTAGSDDDLYVFGELGVGIPHTPLTLKGHLGYTNGSLGLANPTIADDTYADWSGSVEYVNGPVKVGVSYVDTDISNRNVPLIGHFAQQLGRGSTVVGYLGFTF